MNSPTSPEWLSTRTATWRSARPTRPATPGSRPCGLRRGTTDVSSGSRRPTRDTPKTWRSAPEVAIAIYDSSGTPGTVEAVYMSGRAEELIGDELERGIELFDRILSDGNQPRLGPQRRAASVTVPPLLRDRPRALHSHPRPRSRTRHGRRPPRADHALVETLRGTRRYRTSTPRQRAPPSPQSRRRSGAVASARHAWVRLRRSGACIDVPGATTARSLERRRPHWCGGPPVLAAVRPRGAHAALDAALPGRRADDRTGHADRRGHPRSRRHAVRAPVDGRCRRVATGTPIATGGDVCRPVAGRLDDRLRGRARWPGGRSDRAGWRAFRTLRTFETGSWLGREFQGRGIGKEMRAATLIGFRRVWRRGGDDDSVCRQRSFAGGDSQSRL